MGPWESQTPKPHLTTSILGADQTWSLDTLSQIWAFLQQAKDQSDSNHSLIDPLREYLDVLQAIAVPLVEISTQQVLGYKAAILLTQIGADLLRSRLEDFDLEIQKSVSALLLAILQSLRGPPLMSQAVAEHLSPALLELLGDELHMSLLTKDLQVRTSYFRLFVLWLTCCSLRFIFVSPVYAQVQRYLSV